MTNSKKETKKKFWLLLALLIGPLVFYLLILTGQNEFRRLPIIQNNVIDIASLEPESKAFKNHITILCFFGEDLLQHKTNALNLNEKIYKHFNGFEQFQFVVLLPNGSEDTAEQLKKELSQNTDIGNWNFVFTSKENITMVFNSLNTNLKLDDKSYIAQAFIVDKTSSLRGRNKDEDYTNGMLYGYDAETVSQIHQKMVDDVKILLAEYRLALKKNKKKGSFKNPYKKKQDKEKRDEK